MSELQSSVSRCPFSEAAKNFDPFDPQFLQQPFSTLQELRQSEPIFFDEKLGYWIVTRMDDAKAILRNAKDFSADLVLDPIKPLYQSTIENFMRSGFSAGSGALVNDVNPEHDERRKWLAKCLTPQRVKELEPFVREAVTKCIDGFCADGEADLVKQLAHQVPAVVLLHFLAIPQEDIERVKAWAEPTILFSWGHPTEEEQNHMANMLGEFWHYCKAHIAKLRNNLGNDVVSEAIRGQQEKNLWAEDDLIRMVLNFTFAGHDTTTNTAANMFLMLMQHRDAWEELCNDASLIPNAVEECIRYAPAVISHRRRAVNTVVVGGAEIETNDKVLIYFAAANRDESSFEDGERFNIHREGANRHVTFGHGWHACYGAPLARLELKIMLEEMTKRLPDIRLKPDQKITYAPLNSTMRGPNQVIVQWGTARGE
ncbi:cytochrome P450 [Pseudomonas putida]|uniref:Cytochrome P450 n=1 Tax=Pseudomonas putida TaxID=303 RepID=A0AAW6PQJ6_PSEPU|nr:cytochrome P450 [Pseudomonas putida]MDF3872098.1 cytochrome P450 [Pseudomonas putida]MDF3877007.1 cytochrome P450 [Pseudomonas putida]